MPYEIERILGAVSATVWAIDPDKGYEIANMLALRAGHLPRAFDAGDQQAAPVATQLDGRKGRIHVLSLHGTIFPKADMMSEMSGGVSLVKFGRAFDEAASDETAAAIVLDIDSPGGAVGLVEETAAKVYGARREGRPIIAVANLMTASAAYWIAAAADQIVAPPSGRVGSIGVYTMHDDLSERLKAEGIDRNLFHDGARKVELSPYAPLSDEARAQLQRSVSATYRSFTGDVARFRKVQASVVRADPEATDTHYGGGRAYDAREARRLGMIDRVATMDEVLADLTRGKLPRSTKRRAALERHRIALS